MLSSHVPPFFSFFAALRWFLSKKHTLSSLEKNEKLFFFEIKKKKKCAKKKKSNRAMEISLANLGCCTNLFTNNLPNL
jgi:hypothetical protein